MFIFDVTMYIEEEELVKTSRNRVHKHLQLDAVKIKRAQKILNARTETETIERALDFTIDEHERNRLAADANENFVRSGMDIRDVYGKLGE